MVLADWLPLEGVTLVDFTRMAPGGAATLLLADLGATVHKIEHPVGGDDTRHLKPRVGTDSSAQHQYMDRGKRSVRADLKNPEDLARVRSLVEGADAVIESFRPGVADRIGIGYEDLARVNPSLVYLSLSGYGQSGERALAAGHDLNFAGYAGLVGAELPKVLLADVSGGMLAALAIVAGIARARQSGQSAHIDLALADAALVLSGMQFAENLAAHTLETPVESPLNGGSPSYGIYGCADGRAITIAGLEPKFWQRTVELLGRPEWVTRKDDETLIPELAALIASRDQTHWIETLVGPDTCVAPVLDAHELTLDVHLTERGSIRKYPSDAGPLWQVSSPFRNIAASAGC